jgi:hypothetical protein
VNARRVFFAGFRWGLPAACGGAAARFSWLAIYGPASWRGLWLTQAVTFAAAAVIAGAALRRRLTAIARPAAPRGRSAAGRRTP